MKQASSAPREDELEFDQLRSDRGGSAHRKTGAILGVSIGNEPYYSRERLRWYLDWARGQMDDGRFSKFAFLIGDSIHKYDYVVFHEVQSDQPISVERRLEIAQERCLEIGVRLRKAIERSIRATQVPAEVLHWRDLEQLSQYKEVLHVVEDAYRADREFQGEIESQVHQYVRQREVYAKTHIEEEQLKRTGRIELLRNYLVYEVAGLIVLAEYTDYSVFVYPSEDMITFRDIYSGKFPTIRKCLPERPRRQFIGKSF